MTEYTGAERRDPSMCPLTAEQAHNMNNRLANVEKTQNDIRNDVHDQGVESRAAISEMSKDIKLMESRLFGRIEKVGDTFEKTVERLSVEYVKSTDRSIKIESELHKLELRAASAKGYVDGGVEGTKAGVKIGASLIIGLAASAVIVVYLFVTDKLNLSNIFKHF